MSFLWWQVQSCPHSDEETLIAIMESSTIGIMPLEAPLPDTQQTSPHPSTTRVILGGLWHHCLKHCRLCVEDKIKGSGTQDSDRRVCMSLHQSSC